MINIDSIVTFSESDRRVFSQSLTFKREALDVDVLISLKNTSNALPLLVMLNGAVDRTRGNLPVFQRSTWADEIESHVVFVSDPTLSIDRDLSLGWGIGNRDEHGLIAMSETVRTIRDILVGVGIKLSEGTRYFGSSAGGFQALGLAAHDANSHAMAINPQLRVTDYFKSAVDRTLWETLGTTSESQALSEFGERLDVFELFSRVGMVPKIHLVLNAASKEDMGRDFNRLTMFLKSNPGLENRFLIDFYSDPVLGHNPPPKEKTLDLLEKLLQ